MSAAIYQQSTHMKVFGLTGGIGMGKSTAAQLLQERGIPVADTDFLARQIVQLGQPALEEIKRAFGSQVISSDGTLHREELARIVFCNSNKRLQLESITHPRIQELWRAQLNTWRSENHPAAVVVIPLLFETSAEKELDATICVACSVATQQQRLLERRWTTEQVQQRIAAQWPVEKKMANANFVVWNEGGMDVLSAQLSRIIG
jgi:dephospho-CoA kinase